MPAKNKNHDINGILNLIKNNLNSNFKKDKSRIDTIVNLISEYWKEHPELRLGQLLYCLNDGKDIFYLTDEDLIKNLKKQIKKED